MVRKFNLLLMNTQFLNKHSLLKTTQMHNLLIMWVSVRLLAQSSLLKTLKRIPLRDWILLKLLPFWTPRISWTMRKINFWTSVSNVLELTSDITVFYSSHSSKTRISQTQGLSIWLVSAQFSTILSFWPVSKSLAWSTDDFKLKQRMRSTTSSSTTCWDTTRAISNEVQCSIILTQGETTTIRQAGKINENSVV